ncbi:MAG: hypothetical protein U1G08_00225 [Verrucomicrobiota bacterium]
MNLQRTLYLSSVILTAVACYVVHYCFEKLRRSGSSVGDDIIVIGYIATLGSTGLSLLGAFLARDTGVRTQALTQTTFVVCLGALGFWTWIHLSGVVVPYSTLEKQ